MSDFKPIQEEVNQWIKTVGVRYFNELTNMAQLTEEVGEVARIIARRYGEQSEKESDQQKDLGEELADVLFVVVCLANQTGTDLQTAWERRMADKTNRDKNRHKKNPKLQDTQSSFEFWVMSFEWWVLSDEFWVMSFEFWVFSFEF